jgi:signal peptidase I
LLKASLISEDILNNGIDVRIKTSGPSMFPLIRTGDKVILRPEKNLKVGDIIVFKRDDQMVCHRLVRVFERDGIKYQTCGDTHFGLDEPILANQILGKVIKIEREKVSLKRKILILIYPLLSIGRLNAFVITFLIRVRKLLAFKKS